MKEYHDGEIVLVLFPFADASGAKRRPALIIRDTGDEDVIVCRVTGQVAQTTFDVKLEEWSQEGLQIPSVVRVHKVATLEKRLIERRLGVLTPNDWLRVRAKIRQLWTSL